MTMALDTNKWPIFSLLDTSFLVSIRVACILGSAGNEAMVITNDDEVYALGSNCSGCLGLGGDIHRYINLGGLPSNCMYSFSGDAVSGLEPRRVDPLCKKNIVSFAYGSGPHVLAVTKSIKLCSILFEHSAAFVFLDQMERCTVGGTTATVS
jgi:RCC1 and BTB domain-containing protein